MLNASVQFICNRLGLRIIRRRLYRWRYFEAESRRVFSTIDRARYEELIGQYPPTVHDARKTRENEVLLVYVAHVLGLPESPPLRALDIGSKAGMFPFIARFYGHDALASDIPDVLTRQPNAGFLDLFKVPAVPLKVEAFKPIPPFDRRFDLITGFRTRFHSRYPWETGRDREEHWGVPEWDFFLRDLAMNHLTEHGRIFFVMNRLQELGRRAFVPVELDAYFGDVGGRLHNHRLSFETLERLRRRPG